MVENFYPVAGSVRHVQPNGSGFERSKPIMIARISSNNLSNKKTFCFAGSAEVSGTRAILIV